MKVAIYENRHVEVLSLTAHVAEIVYNDGGLEITEFVPRSEIEELDSEE